MYIKILIYYILGYINITVEGFFIEKFINACISKKIFFWNSTRTKSTVLSANVGIKNFREVANTAKKCKCKIKINQKKGLPFLLNRYKKRKIFAISLFAIIAIMIAVSNFIWNIEIIGIDNDDKKAEIIELLKTQNVEIGTYKNKVNLQTLINKVRIARNDIAWVGMKIKGTNLIVEIVEADEKPEIIDENDYCNIVAKKDGVVTKIQAQNGTPAVKEGDTVKKGDVLIKGVIEGKFTESRFVHSEGDVFAKVWYIDTEKVYYNNVMVNRTGNTEKKYSLNINNFQINFFKTLSKFEKYDTIRTVKKLKLASNFYLPIEVIVNENYEKQNNQTSYTKEEAKELAIQQAKSKLNSDCAQVPENAIANIYTNVKENDEYIEVEVIYEIVESIGTKEKF